MTGYPKAARLRTKLDFRRTLDLGRKTVCPKMVLFGRERGVDEPIVTGLRLGLIVSRKVGDAVTRNRVKRHLREGFRHLCAELSRAEAEPALDVVIIARHDTAKAPGEELREAFWRCLERHLRRPMPRLAPAPQSTGAL